MKRNNLQRVRARARLQAAAARRRRQLGVARLFSRLLALVGVAVTLLAARPASADRLKDLVTVRGVRSNDLVGYGLVVGLGRSGDDQNSAFTVQSVATMLRRLGVQVDAKKLRLTNVAAVMVTATLPPFARAGTKLDVVASSLGNATSLQGGTLLETPLVGPDGRVYALAQGSLVVGGYEAAGKTGTTVKKNHTTVGRVPGGASVEREVPAEFLLQREAAPEVAAAPPAPPVDPAAPPVDPAAAAPDPNAPPKAPANYLVLGLRTPDFTNAQRIVTAIEAKLGAGSARANDPAAVEVDIPEAFAKRPVALVADLEALDVTADLPARVVINERTGTVVVGAEVRLGRVAVAHGSLTVEVSEQTGISQPQPFAQGRTAAVPQTGVSVGADGVTPLQLIDGGASISDVVKALAALGVSPRDLVPILQALAAAGALRAEIVVQ